MGSWNVNVVFPQENKAWMIVLLQVIYVEKKDNICCESTGHKTNHEFNLNFVWE